MRKLSRLFCQGGFGRVRFHPISAEQQKGRARGPAFGSLEGWGAYQLVSTEPLNFSSMNFFTSGVW